MTRTYLVPIANEKTSLAAFHLACLKAERNKGKIQLLHVVSPPDDQTPFTIADLVRAERMGEAIGFLQPLKEDAETRYGITAEILIKEGHIHEQLAAAVTPYTVFIALCRDHEHGSGELLEWLVTHLDKTLHVPLMVVPASLTDEQLKALA